MSRTQIVPTPDGDTDENFGYDKLGEVYILHCLSLSLISYFFLLYYKIFQDDLLIYFPSN